MLVDTSCIEVVVMVAKKFWLTRWCGSLGGGIRYNAYNIISYKLLTKLNYFRPLAKGGGYYNRTSLIIAEMS